MLDLPEDFRRNMTTVFPDGAEWLERLPATIDHYAQRWGLTVGAPFLLSYSYAAPATREDGSAVVLKLSPVSDDFIRQGHALRAFAGRGVARLLEEDIENGAVLLERLLPGRMLSETIPPGADGAIDPAADEAATRIGARVMQQVWQPAPAGDHPFHTPGGWVEDHLGIPARLGDRPCPLPERFIQRTAALYRDLDSSAGAPYLIAGDLHHFNILSIALPGGEPGWKAIDPFGVVAERELEPGAFVLNPWLNGPVTPALETLLRRRFEVFAEELGFDQRRITAYAALYASISIGWTAESEGLRDPSDLDFANLFARWAGYA